MATAKKKTAAKKKTPAEKTSTKKTSTKKTSAGKKTARTAKPETRASGPRAYTFVVSIIQGPMTDEFVKKNPEVSRTIQIRGDSTLEDLHEAVFDAFGREDDHMYEFQFGKGPMDPEGLRFVLKDAGDFGEGQVAGCVEKVTLDALGLKKGKSFGYWFDFGDDWWHQIDVEDIEDTPSGKYPRVIKKVGRNPPQYVEW